MMSEIDVWSTKLHKKREGCECEIWNIEERVWKRIGDVKVREEGGADCKFGELPPFLRFATVFERLVFNISK